MTGSGHGVLSDVSSQRVFKAAAKHVARLTIDAEMGNHAHGAFSKHPHAHAPLHQRLDQKRGARSVAGDLKDNDVGFDRQDALNMGQRGNSLADQGGEFMVLGKSIDIMIKGVETGRRDVSRLPQTAAPLLLEFPGIVDERGGAREDCASERPKALREIDPDRVVKIAVVANRNSRFHRSIE